MQGHGKEGERELEKSRKVLDHSQTSSNFVKSFPSPSLFSTKRPSLSYLIRREGRREEAGDSKCNKVLEAKKQKENKWEIEGGKENTFFSSFLLFFSLPFFRSVPKSEMRAEFERKEIDV